ncbi:MAG: DUF6603 domain-containing protein [Verrucomicrobiota bacterium]
MTDGIPVAGPISVNTGEALELAKDGAIRVSPYLAAGIAIANFGEVLDIVEDLVADAARTLASRSEEEFCGSLRAWGDDLAHLAEVILGPVVTTGSDVVQTLAIELLRSRFERLASMLTLAGAIVDDPGLGSHIDRQKLRDFMLVTPELVDESFWDELFGPGDSGSRMVAMLAALLVVAPQTISALNVGDLRIAPLLPPPTAANASTAWKNLRANSTGWIPITFPLRHDDQGHLEISSLPDLRGGFVPELAISLLFRSQRRPAGGRTVTDFEFWVHPSVDAPTHEVGAAPGMVAHLEPGVRVGLGYDGGAGTWNAVIEPRPGSPVPAANEATLRIGRESGEDTPDLIFGPAYDTRILARNIGAELHFREQGEPSAELVGKVEGFGVVVTNRWFRSLGETTSSLRDGLRFDVDLEARLAEGAGFSFQADGALAVRLNLGKTFTLKVLKLTVHSIMFQVPIRATQDHFDIRAEVRPHWSATIGPATLVMDGAGAWVGWWADDPGGDKGCIGLLPPTGIGLLLELQGAAGGGFLDFTGGANDRYGGVVTLRIGSTRGLYRFTATAFGIHELTGAPTDADRGHTFVIVIGTSFRPGWHIAYGIFLIGVGGIIGFNRRADTDALRERLTSGAVGNLLFAEDPVRNAPVLLGDLDAAFPPKSGYHVFGLTLQLGWIPLQDEYLVRLAIGVILELDDDDNPSKAILIGSLLVTIPKHEDFLTIQIDAVGVLDFGRHTLEIDATIRRGTVMGLFKITGDGGVRSSWGDPPYMLATLGGFHPDFHPEPAVFPKLTRILITVDKDHLPKGVELSASAYMAITSNTIQFGAEFKASIKAGNWKITGTIGGDALIRLPFYFDITIKGSVGVTYRGHNLISVKFKGGLAGPSPLVLRGEVCISLLFFDACWSDSYTLGDSGALPRPLVTSLVPVLAAEMALVSNLTVIDDDDGLVLIARHDQSDRVVLSPLGVVTWTQNRVPLGLEVQLFEDGKLDEPQRVEVHASVATDPFLDWFSPGSFLELSEAETLALPAFERHQAGVVASLAAPRRSAGGTVDVTYEEIRLPDTRLKVAGLAIPAHVLERMQATDAPTSIRPGPVRFGVRDDRFGVATGPGPVVADLTAVEAHLAGRASGAASQHAADRLVTVPA